MNEALCSILCDQDEWSFEALWYHVIKFNRDGTGELLCLGDMVWYFCVNLRWKSVPIPSSDADVEATKPTWNEKSPLLGKLNLEITLEKGLANSLSAKMRGASNEMYLSEAAFRNRPFSVAIEKGNFLPDHLIGHEGKYDRRWGLRLVFNKSPHPTRFGFKQPKTGPIPGTDFDKWLIAFARPLPESEKRKKATNDDSYMGFRGECSVS